jgi:hypothetical protein
VQSIDDLIQDYLAALRILDLEAPAALDPLATIVYRRRLLHRIAELNKLSSNPAPGPAPVTTSRPKS